MRAAWAFATSPHGLRLSPRRFWALDWKAYEALVAVHRDQERRRMVRWAIGRSDYRNVHFREVLNGKFTDAPWLPLDLLGEGDREKRTAEVRQSREAASKENARLNKMRPGGPLPEGGGKVRIENGQVINDGVPDVFRQLAEQHEQKKERNNGRRTG